MKADVDMVCWLGRAHLLLNRVQHVGMTARQLHRLPKHMDTTDVGDNTNPYSSSSYLSRCAGGLIVFGATLGMYSW